MRRKLIRQGGGGFTVYLPKKWVDSKGLAEKQEVEITEKDTGLVITPPSNSQVRSINIDIEPLSKNQLRTVIASAYKAGYDEINLKFDSMPDHRELNNIVSTLTGLEIISQEQHSVKMRSFLTDSADEVESLLIKMFQIANTLLKTIMTDWNKTDLNYVNMLRENVLKLRDHSLRMVHLNRFGSDKSYEYYDMVVQIEKFCADVSYLVEFVVLKKAKKTELLSKLLKNFENLFECYAKRDFKRINKLWESHSSIQKMFATKNLIQLSKKEGNLALFSYHLAHRFRHLSSRMVGISL